MLHSCDILYNFAVYLLLKHLIRATFMPKQMQAGK